MRTNILLTAIIAIMVTVSTKADNIGDSKTKQAHSISTRYEAGAVYGSGDYAPMWHFANRQGMGSHKSNWAYARVAVNGRTHSATATSPLTGG